MGYSAGWWDRGQIFTCLISRYGPVSRFGKIGFHLKSDGRIVAIEEQLVSCEYDYDGVV